MPINTKWTDSGQIDYQWSLSKAENGYEFRYEENYGYKQVIQEATNESLLDMLAFMSHMGYLERRIDIDVVLEGNAGNIELDEYEFEDEAE